MRNVKDKKAKVLTVTLSNALGGKKKLLLPMPRKGDLQALSIFCLTKSRGLTTNDVSAKTSL
jgi:hypothetical protein